MKLYISIYLFAITFLLSCNNNENVVRIEPIRDYTFNDSLCKKQYEGFLKINSFLISNYYEIIDSTTIQNEKKILIVSPKILTPTMSNCRNDNHSIINNRLLVVIDGDKAKIYDNVISNSIGAGTSGCELIREYNQGFRLTRQTGQNCKKSYSLGVVYRKENLYIDSIILEYDCHDNVYSKNYSFEENNFPIKTYDRKMIDSLFNLSKAPTIGQNEK